MKRLIGMDYLLRIRLAPSILVLGLSTLFGCGGADAADEDLQADAILGRTESGSAYPEAVRIEGLLGASGYTSECSGAIIAPRVVLTAGHCIVGVTQWTVRAPYASDQVRVSTSSAVYDYTTDSKKVNTSQHDVGLVFLTTPFKLARFPSRSPAAVREGASAVAVGRRAHGPGTRDNLLVVSSPFRLFFGGESRPNHYVARPSLAEGGDSGGPIFLDDTHTIVAVTSGGSSDNMIVARTDKLAGWIDSKVAANGGEGPR